MKIKRLQNRDFFTSTVPLLPSIFLIFMLLNLRNTRRTFNLFAIQILYTTKIMINSPRISVFITPRSCCHCNNHCQILATNIGFSASYGACLIILRLVTVSYTVSNCKYLTRFRMFLKRRVGVLICNHSISFQNPAKNFKSGVDCGRGDPPFPFPRVLCETLLVYIVTVKDVRTPQVYCSMECSGLKLHF